MKKFLSILLALTLTFFVIACNNNKNQTDEKVEEVISLINQLPEEITINDDDAVTTIGRKYASLYSSQQDKVTNYYIYEEALNKLNQIKADLAEEEKALKVVELIDGLDDISTLDFNTQITTIENVVTKYNELNAYGKDKVTNYNKLTNYITVKENLTEAIKLQNQIVEILDITVTLDSEATIQSARDIYANAESDIQKYLDETVIIEAENELAELNEIEELKEKAQVIIDLIAALPDVDKITLNNQTEVNKAKLRYSALTSAAKPYVTNYDKLQQAIDKIEELKAIETDKSAAKTVDDLITALPSKANLTLSDSDNVTAARTAYEKLTTSQKTYVTKLATLVELEEQIKYLVANHEYVVKLYLNGGALDGKTAGTSLKEVTNFTVNYYSTGYWGHYTTDIVMFKTSLIASGDSYTSALKVGFSYSNEKASYIVDQLVASGTALSSELRICDYYLFVASDYAAGYAEIGYINLGDTLEFSANLPESSSESLNCTVTVKRGTTVDYIEKNYKGTNTLDVPTKFGFEFKGWYETSNFSSTKVTEVKEATTLYAKWGVNTSEVTTETILNCISDTATSGTTDSLVLENNDATFTWTSSNNNLYVINGDTAYVNMSYQTHQNQSVTVTCKINYKTGGSKTVTKNITVGPVNYTTMSTSPLCTYFFTSAAYSYERYNERYVKEKTYFSEDTKNTLDIIYYSFIEVNADGTCKLGSTQYVDIVNELKNYNVRVVASIAGTSDTSSKYFAALTADTTKCKAFAKNLMDLVDKYRFDGLDIDWESTSAQYVVASGMNNLSKALKEEMASRQASGGSPYLLTAAVPASSWGLGADRYDFPTLNNYLDYINIMSYDGNRSDRCSHLCPFYSSTKDNGYGFGGVYGVNQISAKGFAKNKLIMGCAGYGKAYSITASTITNNGLGCAGKLIKISAVESYGSFSSGTLYGGAIQALIKTGNYVQYDEYNGGLFVGSYLYNAKEKIFVTYESTTSINEKYAYAVKNNIGLMCWAYTEDTADLVINAMTAAKKGN